MSEARTNLKHNYDTTAPAMLCVQVAKRARTGEASTSSDAVSFISNMTKDPLPTSRKDTMHNEVLPYWGYRSADFLAMVRTPVSKDQMRTNPKARL